MAIHLYQYLFLVKKERLVFLMLNCFRTFVENQFMTQSKVLFLDSQFCAIELYSFPMPDPLSRLVCYGKIWHQVIKVLQLYSIAKLFRLIWILHISLWILGQLSNSTPSKKPARIFIGTALNLSTNLKRNAFLIIWNFLIHEQELFLSLDRCLISVSNIL